MLIINIDNLRPLENSLGLNLIANDSNIKVYIYSKSKKNISDFKRFSGNINILPKDFIRHFGLKNILSQKT